MIQTKPKEEGHRLSYRNRVGPTETSAVFLAVYLVVVGPRIPLFGATAMPLHAACLSDLQSCLSVEPSETYRM